MVGDTRNRRFNRTHHRCCDARNDSDSSSRPLGATTSPDHCWRRCRRHYSFRAAADQQFQIISPSLFRLSNLCEFMKPHSSSPNHEHEVTLTTRTCRMFAARRHAVQDDLE